jgi:hypothetical protein
MRQALEQRLAALRTEYETGQGRLAEIERQDAFLRERLLMLRGAIQALDDLRAELGQAELGQPEPGQPEPGRSGPGQADRDAAAAG